MTLNTYSHFRINVNFILYLKLTLTLKFNPSKIRDRVRIQSCGNFAKLPHSQYRRYEVNDTSDFFHVWIVDDIF